MSKQVILSGPAVLWQDEKTKLNSNFDELYSKVDGVINLKEFGAVGDGVVDDTTAVHAAFDAAIAANAVLSVPVGHYRVTSTYPLTSSAFNLILRGDGSSLMGGDYGSMFILDNSNPSISFMKQTAGYGEIQCKDLNFKCAAYVLDRPFFEFAGNTYANKFIFRDVTFKNVEKPFVFKINSYFQASIFDNVLFRDSGTFYGEIDGVSLLRGTLMTIINSHHEGSVPVNSLKILCDLTGIRKITGINFLLEGSVPDTSWLPLKLSNPHDSLLRRYLFATFKGLWIETVPSGLRCVEQIGGSAVFDSGCGSTPTSKYYIASQGKAIFENSSFIAAASDPSDYIEFENSKCIAEINSGGTRLLKPSVSNIIYKNIQVVADAQDTGADNVVIDCGGGSTVFEYKGGEYFETYNITKTITEGTQYPSSDATYVRKMVFEPRVSDGALNQKITIPLIAKAGTQINFNILAKLPTFASGNWALMRLILPGVTDQILYSPVGDSGLVVDGFMARTLLADCTSISIMFHRGTAPGATGLTTFDLYSLLVTIGNTAPRRLGAYLGKNVITHGSAAPTLGGWVLGDKVVNTTPAVGSPKGWICTVSGTPGTWVSEGNL